MKKQLRKKTNDFEKDFFKLMNNAVPGKTMENKRNDRDIKLIITEEGITQFQNQTIIQQKSFKKIYSLAKEMNKTQVFTVYLDLSILEMSKIVTYEFWYDYVQPKYGKKAKLYYMDTDSFIVHIKTEDIYVDIAKDVETRFQTSNYEIYRLLPKGKN